MCFILVSSEVVESRLFVAFLMPTTYSHVGVYGNGYVHDDDADDGASGVVECVRSHT